MAGAAPPAARVEVTGRTGGDVDPIDPTTPGGQLKLTACVWPDQADRLERLRGGLTLAAEMPADLRQEAADVTLARTALTEGSWTAGGTRSSVHLDPRQRAALAERVSALGAAATRSARFAYRHLEPSRNRGFLVTLTTWPGGRECVLGIASPHGIPVSWGAPPPTGG